MKVRRRNTRPRSPGFTLVELLMVIAIIAILFATLVPLVASVFSMTRTSATKATVKKLHEILQKRQDAFERGFPEFFRREGPFGREYEPANPGHVMFRKQTFRGMFWREAARELGSPNNAGATEEFSAAVLYKLVTEMPTYGTAAEDAGQFNSAEVSERTINGRNVKVFIDSWGNPITYYPFASRVFKPNGTIINRPVARHLFRTLLPNAQLNQDPDDPFEVLVTANYPDNDPEKWYHTFNSYHVPLIVSAGSDGQYGLYPRDDFNNRGHLARPDLSKIEELYDNITNHNVTAGGQ